jgi:hypothetical protein
VRRGQSRGKREGGKSAGEEQGEDIERTESEKWEGRKIT